MQLILVTPCGHEATCKPCKSKNGPNRGKWTCVIRGPTLENAKYKYSEPNQHAAKQVIASFLNIEMSSVTIKGEHNAALVKQEGPRNVTVAASSQSTVMAPPSRAPSIPPQQQQQQQQQVPFASAPTNHFIAHPLMVPSHSQQYQPPLFPNQAGTTMAAPPFNGHAAMTMPPSVAMPFPNGPLPLASQPAMVTSGSFAMPSPVPSAPMSAVSSATRTSTTIVPTAEQEEIYQHAKPPTPLDTSFKVRITAGAGAGKTTTVLDVATRAARLGHNHITYVTFAKAAAVDGARRINEALSGMPNPPTIEARTLHSAAMKVLSEERKEDFTEDHNRLVDDEGLQNFIKRVCEREVQDFLSHAREEINSRNKKDATKGASMLESAERQVLFFIFKTFATFCRSPYTLEQLKDPMFKYRDYYPAKKFHCEGDGEKQGFPKQVYSSKLSKYADIACLVWEAASQQGIRSYDLEMKRAQLKALRIPGSLLLVDESQDMDGCQVDWIAKQCNHGAHVYIVGDAAQTIYSFRGAKSKYMVNIKGAVDFKLTKSWRFGPNIANVANVVLFCKHKSKQTQRDNPTWQPYRVVGGGVEGKVTCDPILQKWKDMPITVISAFNATLLHMAVSMLGMKVDNEENEQTCEHTSPLIKSESTPMPHEANSQPEGRNDSVPIVSDDSSTLSENTECAGGDVKLPAVKTEIVGSSDEHTLHVQMPKIHINGQGENSGIGKWKSVLKQIQHIFDLYKSAEDGHVLPARTFKEFRGERITWDSFCSQVESRELNKYGASIHVVTTFGDKTMDVIRLFEKEVMEKKYSAEDADVILTTTHAAKGMEWHNVQVCDDFVDIFKLSCDGPLTAQRGPTGSNTKRTSWQLHIKNWGDEVNLLYVACTRAKRLLSIPPSFRTFLQDCDMLHDMIRRKKLFKEADLSRNSEISLFGRTQPFSVREILDVYQDLVVPLRNENSLDTKNTLMNALIQPMDGEVDRDDEKALDGDDEFNQFFGYTAKRAAEAVADMAVVTDTSPKRQKRSRASYILEEAAASAAQAPKGISRPYDKIDTAVAKAKCRECGNDIPVGEKRVGVQVYKPDCSQYWCSYFHHHGKCFPTELLPQLRLDPNPNRNNPSAQKKSWSGKKSYGGGYKKSYGGGWKRGGGYRRRWN